MRMMTFSQYTITGMNKKIWWAVILFLSLAGFVLLVFFLDDIEEVKWNEKVLDLEDLNSTESVWSETQEFIYVEKKDRVDFNAELTDRIMETDSSFREMGYSPVNAIRDEENRPEPIVALQNDFGKKYNATFIGEKGEGIYLTFTMSYEYANNGVNNTDKILEILEEKNVKATFFVTGEYVKSQPDMCKKIVEKGHTLGCHGWKHPQEGVASWSVEDFVSDTKKIYDEIYNLTGKEPYLYRFGSGIWNERALAILDKFGFSVIFHSYTYKDYDTEDQMEDSYALQMLVNNLHNGEILYLHTISNTNVEIMSEFIDIVREKGYEFEVFDD